jgi:hypothetical protein
MQFSGRQLAAGTLRQQRNCTRLQQLPCCPNRLAVVLSAQIVQALSAAQLQAGAVCIRFPAEFRLGAFSNPDAALRQRAVQLAAAGCAWAAELGAPELIVWSPYDGYDYHFQVRCVVELQLLAVQQRRCNNAA